MGTISIMLGIIIFIGFTLGGVYAAPKIYNTLLNIGTTLHNTFTAIDPSGLSQTKCYIIVIGVCVFIGLLICLNLVMHGLTYNKVRALKRRHHH